MTGSWLDLGVFRQGMVRAILLLALALATIGVTWTAAQAQSSQRAPPKITGELRHAGGVIRLTYEPEQLPNVEADALLDWVRKSATAISVYFGRFPVALADITIKARSGEIAVGGRAWSDTVPRISITLNRRIGNRELARDSVLVHELAHLAIPDLDERHLWLHEGIATYVEFVARAQAGFTSPRQMWAEFVREMPAGVPNERANRGLDGVTSIDRVYWGGALFCLLADIEIRRETDNRYGLQDALRGLQAAGGDLSKTWSLARILSTADAATGTRVMRNLYRRHGARAAEIDLDDIWRELGIVVRGRQLRFDNAARLAKIRLAITDKPSSPILVANPVLMRANRQPRAIVRSGDAGAAYASPDTAGPGRFPVRRR